jgi:hypothetical protein
VVAHGTGDDVRIAGVGTVAAWARGVGTTRRGEPGIADWVGRGPSVTGGLGALLFDPALGALSLGPLLLGALLFGALLLDAMEQVLAGVLEVGHGGPLVDAIAMAAVGFTSVGV